MRDHQCLRQLIDPRKRKPLHQPPWRKQSDPGIRGGRWNDKGQRYRSRERHGGEPGPEPVPRPGHGLAKITAAGRLRHLADGRLAERSRAILFAAVADDFHDAEQLVAQRRKPTGDQPRQAVEAAMAPDPAVERDRNRRTTGHGRSKEHPPHRGRRVAEPVEQKKQQPSHEHAEDRAADGLGRLDRPDGASKRIQLPPQPVGKRKATRTHVRRRQVAAHASPHVMIAMISSYARFQTMKKPRGKPGSAARRRAGWPGVFPWLRCGLGWSRDGGEPGWRRAGIGGSSRSFWIFRPCPGKHERNA